MDSSTMTFNKNSAAIITLVVGILFGGITLFITYNSIEQRIQKEILATTNSYIDFQDKVNDLINDNVQLLQGYLAYIKSNPEVSEDETYSYLEHLTENNKRYIRNIGIVKDTTIIYNYPREGNEKAIGIDLATIEGQREVVLRTKSLLQPVFQGPLTLVQGGEAFIVRLPVVDSNNEYWGQVSVVLRADVILDDIEKFAGEQHLKVSIATGVDEELWVYGDESLLDEEPLQFAILSNMMQWTVYVVPDEGWNSYSILRSLSVLLALVVFVVTCGLVYYAQQANYQIRHNSYHDRLTGLYNRHFFEEYHVMILSGAERNSEMFGLVLVDLNDFKQINDTYGHKAGDLVLVESARLLEKVSRVNEAVFRLGGDEFLLIVPKLVYEDELSVIKDRIEMAFIREFRIKGYNIEMMPSVGTSVYPRDGKTFDEILHRADTTMYEEKNISKRNRI